MVWNSQNLIITQNTIMDEKDSYGKLPDFLEGDRVLVLPLKMEAAVIEQMLTYDYPEYFWGNVRVLYNDNIEGTSNSWQLRKL